MTWLGSAIIWRRWQVLAAFFIVGMLGAAGIILGTAAIRNLRHERDRAIHAEILSRTQVEDIAKRVFHLESPSRDQILREIRHAVRICSTSVSCRVKLSSVTQSVLRNSSSSTQTSTTSTPSPSRPTPAHRKPHPAKRPSSSTSPSPAPTPPPPSSPVSTGSDGVVTVTTPVAVPCTHVKLGPVDIKTSSC